MNEWQRRIGVGEPSRAFLTKAGTSRRRLITTEEGPTRGKVGGAEIDHWDGRVDAVVRPETIRASMSMTNDI